MRGLKVCRLALLLGAIHTAFSGSVRAEGDFQLSFGAGSPDSTGRFMGGTEIRILTAHGRNLYAGNG